MADGQKLAFEYDGDGDVLYISLGTREPSYCEEIDDVVLVEKGFFSNQITGFRILDASRRKVKIDVLLERILPEVIERERTELESILGEREKILSDLVGTIPAGLSKEIQATA